MPDTRGQPVFHHARKLRRTWTASTPPLATCSEGMDVVDAIADTPTGRNDRPLKEQRMKKVTVNTFGEEYSAHKLH